MAELILGFALKYGPDVAKLVKGILWHPNPTVEMYEDLFTLMKTTGASYFEKVGP